MDNERRIGMDPIEEILPRQSWVRDIKGALQNLPENETVKDFLTNSILHVGRMLFADKEQEIRKILDQVMIHPFSNNDEMAEAVGTAMYNFTKLNFTPAQFEKKIRTYIHDRDPELTINEMLHFSINKHTLHLHIAPSRTVQIGEKLNFLRQGLKDLAIRMLSDKNLQEVNEIKSVSWIVAENPNLLTKLGFQYLGNMTPEQRDKSFPGETREIGEAVIQRNDFLRKYIPNIN